MARHNINLASIAETAYLGVRRAYVFMGLGHNAASDTSLVDFHLPGLMQIEIVPETNDDTTLAHFKSAFSVWVIQSGFRELLETFAVFLDNIHALLRIVDNTKDGRVVKGGVVGVDNDFSREGIAGKLSRLRTEYGLHIGDAESYRSLTQARNCITHRRAIVGEQDCNKGQSFVLRWRAPQMSIKSTDGVTRTIDFDRTSAVSVKKDELIIYEFLYREHYFALGQHVNLLPSWLHQICLMIELDVAQFIQELPEYLEKKGIKINRASIPKPGALEPDDSKPVR